MFIYLNDTDLELVNSALINLVAVTEEAIHLMEFDQANNGRDRTPLIEAKKFDIENLNILISRLRIF